MHACFTYKVLLSCRLLLCGDNHRSPCASCVAFSSSFLFSLTLLCLCSSRQVFTLVTGITCSRFSSVAWDETCRVSLPLGREEEEEESWKATTWQLMLFFPLLCFSSFYSSVSFLFFHSLSLPLPHTFCGSACNVYDAFVSVCTSVYVYFCVVDDNWNMISLLGRHENGDEFWWKEAKEKEGGSKIKSSRRSSSRSRKRERVISKVFVLSIRVDVLPS